MRKLIRRSDDERVEGVARNKAAGARVWVGTSARLRRILELRPRRVQICYGSGALRHSGGVGNEHQSRLCTAYLAQRLGEDHGIVLGQPFDEQKVRDADG